MCFNRRDKMHRNFGVATEICKGLEISRAFILCSTETREENEMSAQFHSYVQNIGATLWWLKSIVSTLQQENVTPPIKDRVSRKNIHSKSFCPNNKACLQLLRHLMKFLHAIHCTIFSFNIVW